MFCESCEAIKYDRHLLNTDWHSSYYLTIDVFFIFWKIKWTSGVYLKYYIEFTYELISFLGISAGNFIQVACKLSRSWLASKDAGSYWRTPQLLFQERKDCELYYISTNSYDKND